MKAMNTMSVSEPRGDRAATNAAESCNAPRGPGERLTRFGAVGALFASLCCLGFSALISVLSAIGLGFLIDDAVLLPVLVVFLGVYVAGLVLGWRRHGKSAVLVLGVLVAALNFGLIYVVYVQPIAYAIVFLLVAVSIWDLVERRRVRS